jgi:hypothetical protein
MDEASSGWKALMTHLRKCRGDLTESNIVSEYFRNTQHQARRQVIYRAGAKSFASGQ